MRGYPKRRVLKRRRLLPALCAVLACWRGAALGTAGDLTANLGPYDVRVLEGGVGLSRPLAEELPLLAAGAPWSLTGWMNFTRRSPAPVVIAAIGDVAGAAWRGLELNDGRLSVILGGTWPGAAPAAAPTSPAAAAPLEADHWYAVAATFDGSTLRLYVDGHEVSAAAAATGRVAPRLELAPAAPGTASAADSRAHFGGALALFTLTPTALAPAAVQALASSRPDFSLITFNSLGVGWPWQEHAWRGLQEPQDPWTLPKAMQSAQCARRASPVRRRRRCSPAGLARGRSTPGACSAAPALEAGGAQLSQPEYDDSRLVCGGRARHRAHHADRARRLSGSGLRAQQSGHSGFLEPAGLLVPQRIRRARRAARSAN